MFDLSSFKLLSMGSFYEGTAWRVMTNSDLTEGRGYQYILGFYTTEFVAKQAALGKGVMGTPATVVKVNVTIYVPNLDGPVYVVSHGNGSKDLYSKPGYELHSSYTDPKVLRERALAKLTAEEKELLGLKDE